MDKKDIDSSDEEAFEDCSESANQDDLCASDYEEAPLPGNGNGDLCEQFQNATLAAGNHGRSGPSPAECAKDNTSAIPDSVPFSSEHPYANSDGKEAPSADSLKHHVLDSEPTADALSGEAVPSGAESSADTAPSKNVPQDDDLNAIDEEMIASLDRVQSMEQIADRQQVASRLKDEGNALFKSGDLDAARQLYTDALRQCPLTAVVDRAVLFSNRAACRAEVDRKGALMDCARAVELNPEYLRATRRYARLLERDDDNLDKALDQWKRALEQVPGDPEASGAVLRLPSRINERNERLKTEMLGKLKDLGNMVLKPFGMSTDMFKMEPTGSGGYNIKFDQNSK